jgi:hypothetical protein
MKSNHPFFIFLVWIAVLYSGVITSGSIQAQDASPALKPSVEIEDIRVIGETRLEDASFGVREGASYDWDNY